MHQQICQVFVMNSANGNVLFIETVQQQFPTPVNDVIELVSLYYLNLLIFLYISDYFSNKLFILNINYSFMDNDKSTVLYTFLFKY